MPMALLVGAMAANHHSAMAIQKSLSVEMRRALLDLLETGLGEVVSVADRLVSVSRYFWSDIPAMHARLFLEKLGTDRDPCLVELESDLADAGTADDGVLAVQALWVLSVLVVTDERADREPGFAYELPEADVLEMDRLLGLEIEIPDSPPPMCHPLLYHESAVSEAWRDLLEVLREDIANAGGEFIVGEMEAHLLGEAEAQTEFMRSFPMETTSLDEILDLTQTKTLRMSFYPYADFLTVHGYDDGEEAKVLYGEYLGSRALQLAQLEAEARRRRRDVVFEDVTVVAGELFAWLEREGMPNTPRNRALYVKNGGLSVSPKPARGGSTDTRPVQERRKRTDEDRKANVPEGDLRMTLCAYGDSPDALQLVEAVVHTGEGEIVECRTWEGIESTDAIDAATDDIMSLAQQYGVHEIRQVSEVLSPEACSHCGERIHTIVTDEDARRSEMTRRLH